MQPATLCFQQSGSSYRQQVTEWKWQCTNKTLFVKKKKIRAWLSLVPQAVIRWVRSCAVESHSPFKALGRSSRWKARSHRMATHGLTWWFLPTAHLPHPSCADPQWVVGHEKRLHGHMIFSLWGRDEVREDDLWGFLQLYWHIIFYTFKVCKVMIEHKVALQNDDHNKAS